MNTDVEKALKEFLQGKMGVVDDMNEDFVHGFVSALIFVQLQMGMNPFTTVTVQNGFQDSVEKVLRELREGR
jgi:hypothetical protein